MRGLHQGHGVPADVDVGVVVALLGHAPGGDDVSPYAAPARATDLGNLPRTYIATGALDLFVDEDIDYATRLIRAGVPVEFRDIAGRDASPTNAAGGDSTRAAARPAP